MKNRGFSLSFYNLVVFLPLCMSQVATADPPVVHESATKSVAGVVGVNTAGGDGVFGIGKGTSGRGVVGTSESHNGVVGISANFDAVAGNSITAVGVFGASTSGRGVVGVSTNASGVEGNSTSGTGVWGATSSKSAAGGEFHNNGGGDLIRAGKDTVFRVAPNGDVFVRGQLIGTTGAQGPQGPKGDPGPPGPL